MKKKIVFVVILLGFLGVIYGQNYSSDVSVSSVENAMKSEKLTKKLHRCTDRDLMKYLGLDYKEFKGYFYYKGTNALSVKEIFVAKVSDKDMLPDLKEKINLHIKNQIKLFDGYGPAQVAQLKNAVVKSKGNFLFFCVSKNVSDYEEVFQDVV